jgi:hypothetical protein
MSNCANCPIEYYINCSNSPYRCGDCQANNEQSSKLYYKPKKKEGKLAKHPSARENSKEKKKSTNQGRKTERKLAKKNPILKPTIDSGAVYNDGDYKIGTGIGNIQVDSKHHSTRESFSLSQVEYRKGLQQGTECWLVTNKNEQTVAVLTYKLFNRICNFLRPPVYRNVKSNKLCYKLYDVDSGANPVVVYQSVKSGVIYIKDKYEFESLYKMEDD